MSKSFAFVLNNIEVQGALPVLVAPGHLFEKASTEEISKIKEIFDLLKPFPHAMIKFYPYEVDTAETSLKSGTGWSYNHVPLPKERWKYWIVSFEGTNAELEQVQSAAHLLKNDLELGFHILGNVPGGSGFVWHGAKVFSFFDDPAANRPAITVTCDEIAQIRENYSLIKEVCADHEDVARAFQKLTDLKTLPRSSELVVIGLFSIIESLVTHNPGRAESGDSLTHQIRTKMPLLSKRFQRDLDRGNYFGAISEKKMWETLYKYRSIIAHGDHCDFENNELKKLKDRKNVTTFLHEVVKSLLLLALREPVLVSDLKKC